MGDGIERIQEKIYTFKRKYYLNLLVRGLLLTLSILFFYFLIATLLEYTLWFGPWMRFFILLSFFITVTYCVYRFPRNPISFWISKKGINDEQSARLIGASIPTVKDRLVNFNQKFSPQAPFEFLIQN